MAVSRIFCCSALLLGLWRPASSATPAYVPRDIDFDKVEIWPLSGGVAHGVEVTLTTGDKGFSTSSATNPARIDFLTKDYEVAFRFELDVARKMVVRNAAPGDVWQAEGTRGGWPFAETPQKHTIKFLRTPAAWAITIDGLRMPWFDFGHVHEGSVVYAAVHTGFDDGEVVDRRQGCAVECSPEECTDNEGNSVCKDDGACYYRIDAPSALTCSNQTTSDWLPGSMGHCCDGRQLTTIALDVDETQVGKWVKVHDNAAIVAAACDSFSYKLLTGSSNNCPAAVGYKIRIEGVNTTTGMYNAWVPQLYNNAVGQQNIDIPPDVLAPSAQSSTLVDNIEAVADKFVAEKTHGLVTSSEQTAVDRGIKQWSFLNMIKLSFNNGVNPDDWWLSYSLATWPGIQDVLKAAYFVDEETGHTSCANDDEWRDKQGNNCGNYSTGVWCEDHGVATQAFVDATGAKTLDILSNTSGWHSGYMCCQCGGGFHDAPVGARAIFQ